MRTILSEKNDIKIFILYLLRHIGYPLQFSDINDIVVQDEYVNYFDFADCFAELLETGNIEEIRQDNGVELYAITAQGCEVAENLESNILLTIRERSLKNALRLLSFKKRGAEIKCVCDDRGDGACDMTCLIKEHKEEILRIQIKLDSKEEYEKMKQNFCEKPEVVYRGVLALLSGEVDYLLN